MRSLILSKLLPLVATFALCMGSTGTQAHTFCVANAATLQLALNTSSDGGAYGLEANVIQVVAGTYSIGTLANQTFHYVNTSTTAALYLEGGWNAGCTERKQQAELTILDGNHANQVLSLDQVAKEIDVSSFTIQNGDTTLRGGGLSINSSNADNSRPVVFGNIFRNNHTTSYGGGVNIYSGTSNMFFQNNVVAHNSADAGYGGGELVANNVLGFYNNTFAYNTTSQPGGTGGLYIYVGAATGFVEHSIFWGNNNCGIYINSANVRLDHNDYGSRCGTTPLTEIDDLNLAPQFVDVAGDDFHLASNSPLIGTIDAYLTAIDPDGHQGPAHGLSDRGAYFETIFTDGVESN